MINSYSRSRPEERLTSSACSRNVCQQSMAFPKLLLENEVETISLLTSAKSCICRRDLCGQIATEQYTTAANSLLLR